jgi:hypothetical protein
MRRATTPLGGCRDLSSCGVCGVDHYSESTAILAACRSTTTWAGCWSRAGGVRNSNCWVTTVGRFG